MILRKCLRCLNEKTADNFGPKKGGKFGLRSWCKSCVAQQAKSYIRSDQYKKIDSARRKLPERKEKMREYVRKNSKKDSSKKRARNAHLKHRFGINLEIYEEMLRSQNEKCAICLTHKSGFKYNLYVDHNHATGAVRGLLCFACNTGLGNFKDKTDSLKRAINYLEEN